MAYNQQYKGSIADSLTPTFENVVREFITITMSDILFDDKKISFKFIFRQPEAIHFIEKVLEKYVTEYYSGFKESASRIIETLKYENEGNDNLPSLIINDYQLFFELLRQYYEKVIELYFQRTKMSSFPVYEMQNCFEQIWLRATPEDFNNPERFLQRQVQMINDTTFEKYDNETLIGPSSYFNNHVICISNEIARTWDEMPREFRITIYDKKSYHRTELFDKPHYTLPVIRYGIYEKDSQKICYIGSIQNIGDKTSEEVFSDYNRVRSEVNKGIPNKTTFSDVEPSYLIVLSIFINFLHHEGITSIEIPSMYVLDYQYHQNRNTELTEKFQSELTTKMQNIFPEKYQKAKRILENDLNKEDSISRNKTERFVHTFMRLAHHYPKSEIKSYAGELGNYLHVYIPVVQIPDDINNDFLKEMYMLVEGFYGENKMVGHHNY